MAESAEPETPARNSFLDNNPFDMILNGLFEFKHELKRLITP